MAMKKTKESNKKYHVSDRELAQRQWDAIQAMPKIWLTDIEVNKLYTRELRSRHQKATVFWPALGNQLLPEQIKQLEWELTSEATTIFIPLNNGNHWDFVALERKKAPQEGWLVNKIKTPGDNHCGRHTVTQSMQILDNGLEAYSNAHPDKVRTLNQSDAIYTQIEQALGNRAVSKARDSSVDNLATDMAVAINESLELQQKNKFDFTLVKLAEYEALGYSTETLCGELTQMLADMPPHAREFAINRLEASNLAKKSSIAKVIENCYERLFGNHLAAKPMSVSANPYLLIPESKTAKQPEEEEKLIAALQHG